MFRVRRLSDLNGELAGCSGGAPDKNPNTALFRIDIIKVPLKAPQNAKIVNSPRSLWTPDRARSPVLTNGGTHGALDKPTPTDQCHDITVYSAIGLAAGACEGNGILLDIKDPANPKRVDAVNDPNYSYWHSASFSNDGKKVVFTDEWGGGLGARCRATDPNVWGADSVFNLENNKLKFASYYKMPAAQGDTRKLRCAQRLADSCPGPRHSRPGMVSGRRFGDGLYGPGTSKRDRVFRPRPDRSEHARPRRRLVGLLVQRKDLRFRDRPRPRRL